MKEDRKFYRQLRNAGVPFMDAHKMAKKLAKCKSIDVFHLASEANWSRPGKSDYKWNELDEELYSYGSLILPNGSYLIDHSHEGLYISDKLPHLLEVRSELMRKNINLATEYIKDFPLTQRVKKME